MEEISDIFVYDESSKTGLRWKVDRLTGAYKNIKRVVAGQEAGSLDARGHSFITRFNGKIIKVHRLIMLLHGFSLEENQIVDHIDGNPTNNIITNLRITTQAINTRNKKKQKTNISGKTGVFVWVDNKGNKFWKARCVDINRRRLEKCFSINKYGYEEAFILACNSRDIMINELNNMGQNYSLRHGN